MISQEFRYAVRGAVRLAIVGDAMTVKEIAEIETIPARFLEQIFLKMRRAGLLLSRRGRSGGYILAREPEAISLSDVRTAVSGVEPFLACLDKIAPQQCVDCMDMETCAIRKAFSAPCSEAEDAMMAMTLKRASLEAEAAKQTTHAAAPPHGAEPTNPHVAFDRRPDGRPEHQLDWSERHASRYKR